MGKPEKSVEEKFRDGIKSIGGKAYKFVSPGNNGVPDRVVCLPDGRTVFVELKSPTGVLSKMQERRIAELRRMKQNVYVLHSVEEVRKFLEEIK